ncbi:MAG: DUF2760 domain-containing protein [Planctomycetes bacterium]|nr:DUF2760 domain-containing protein [Planctomycetota bacterium]
MAFRYFFKILGSDSFAESLTGWERTGGSTTAVVEAPKVKAPVIEKPKAPEKPAKPEKKEPDYASALNLLSCLQSQGRLVDFAKEDLSVLSKLPATQVVAAVKEVHRGIADAVEKYCPVEPIMNEKEGSKVTVAAGFDPYAIKLVGSVTGDPPFTGTLRHHGWKVKNLKLPELSGSQDPKIIRPAEVEL